MHPAKFYYPECAPKASSEKKFISQACSAVRSARYPLESVDASSSSTIFRPSIISKV
jgi:hypothetical protein